MSGGRASGYKGLDFAYLLMIRLMRMFRKLPSNYKIDVKTMISLFDSFVVHQCGPIKNQTCALLIELYTRLSKEEKN